jgi:hypothetical protein
MVSDVICWPTAHILSAKTLIAIECAILAPDFPPSPQKKGDGNFSLPPPC